MTPEDLVGQKVGDYQLESILGSGGMATVYRARTTQGEAVALKTLFPPPGVGQEMLARFQREAKTAAKLRHPAIVSILDIGQAAGHTFMVMTLIEGQTLAARLHAVGRFDEATAADIIWQIADALHYAHSQNVIHRDIKPSNILLSPDGKALLSDFGVALALDDPVLTRTGYIVGTPAYIAPEQAAGQRPVDGRADLYSLGVVLFQMLTGNIPFQGTTPEVLHAHVYKPPPTPSMVINISKSIEQVILRALAKDPSRRFQSGLEMAQALAKFGQEPSTKIHMSAVETRTYPALPAAQAPSSGPQFTTPQLQRQRLADENPFFYGGAVSPELFYGRQELVSLIVQRVQARTPQSVSIVGERRMGKSSLLNYFRAYADQNFPTDVVIIYLDLMKAYSRTRTGLMKALRRALRQVWREPWSAAEDGDLMAFDFALEELQADNRRLLLCLDEVENLTQRAAEFNDMLEDWRACAQMGQMAIVAASARPLADLCVLGGLTSPFYNIFSQHRLGLLAANEWQALITEHMSVSDDDLAFIEKIGGGQPFFTQMAASHLWDARVKGAVDYEPLYQELWFQAHAHFNHLWRGLTPAEQTVLRQLSGADGVKADARAMAALERRGLVREARPFSDLFTEMIVGDTLET